MESSKFFFHQAESFSAGLNLQSVLLSVASSLYVRRLSLLHEQPVVLLLSTHEVLIRLQC